MMLYALEVIQIKIRPFGKVYMFASSDFHIDENILLVIKCADGRK